jgi:sortase A
MSATHRKRSGHRVARTVAAVGRVLIAAGVLLILFIGYQLWGTNINEANAQKSLRGQFDQLVQAHPGATSTTTAGAGDNAPGANTIGVSPGAPAATGNAPKIGDVIGRIEIPKLHVKKVMVEGVSDDELRRGPGHYPTTPLPGQKGNAGIAGHRTTYGAPFADVDKLDTGDKIMVTTVQGTFYYRVMAKPIIVAPSDVEVLNDFGDNRLTLTACHPKYSASQRIIVQALLVGAPVAPLAGQAKGGAMHVGLGLGWEQYLPMFWWAMLCLTIWAITWAASKELERRGFDWRRWAPYAVGTPVFLMALWVLFGHVTTLMPSNY